MEIIINIINILIINLKRLLNVMDKKCLEFICHLNEQNPVCILDKKLNILAHNKIFKDFHIDKKIINWETSDTSWGSQQILDENNILIKWNLNRPVLSNLIDDIPFYVWIIDIDGICLYFGGQNLNNIFKISSEIIIGKNMLDLLDERYPSVSEDIRKSLNGTQSSDIYEYKKENGTSIIFESHFSPIFEGDKIIGASGISIDITKHLNKGLLDSVKLKAEFLSVISHELRSPLVGIIGFSELLLDTNLNMDQKDYVKTIYERSNLLKSTINDILDYSKLESGNVELLYESFNLKDSIDEVLNQVQTSAKIKDLIINKNIDCSEVLLLGDNYRLKQILYNILSNAIKFTSIGFIEIVASIIEQDEKFFHFKINIKDTGIGIDKSLKDKLFEPFLQADSSISRKYGGSGLGLAITKILVNLMSGSLGFKSDINKGSEFWVDLKFNKKIDTGQKSFIKRIKSINEIKILIADDNEKNIQVLNIFFKKIGIIDVVTVQNGIDALKLYKYNKFDIIFLDVAMPKMGGLEVCSEIRKNDKTQIIISISSNTFVLDSTNINKFGFSDILNKPIKLIQVQNLITKWTKYLI
jgi:PAS domain S-box-containing protein